MSEKATRESVYLKTRESNSRGYAPRSKESIFFLEELLREGKVKKIGKKYYIPEVVPELEEVFNEIKEAGSRGVHLSSLEASVVQPLLDEGKIKAVGKTIKEKKYFLSEFAPLWPKEIVERLLDLAVLRKSGKKFVFTQKISLVHEPLPNVEPEVSQEKPSLLEFFEAVQDLYLRRAGQYRESIPLMPFIRDLASQVSISRDLAEKWILELPKIFIGIVDLRPFGGEEHGLLLRDGTEVTRIYISEGLVGI